MNPAVRHRVVHSLSLTLLKQETNKLAAEGWRAIGEPALAAPVDIKRPPYWVQALYLGNEVIPLESQHLEVPEHSKVARLFRKNGART